MTNSETPPRAWSALAEITAERQRQIEAEGWSLAHDDAHADGELLKAGIVYYLSALGAVLMVPGAATPIGWPWSPDWWKPKGARRDLVRAGALFMAERDRLQRLPACDASYVNQWIDFAIVALNQMGAPNDDGERAAMVRK